MVRRGYDSAVGAGRFATWPHYVRLNGETTTTHSLARMLANLVADKKRKQRRQDGG
jgi:hypothetical protein